MRPAETAEDAIDRPSEPRFDIGETELRLAIDEPAVRLDGAEVLCEAAIAGEGLDEAELLDGVILLTVGREVVPSEGCAAAMPAFDPSMLARVGEIFGRSRLALDRFRKALLGMLALLPATGSPRSRVFRETAVNAPGLLA